ncbi:unnamed protein product [Schistocephalus solidus]|uniref:Uncharacterized protein n=1 Tax=Schistocephalus solidus TaxID=70667 RepID=A0A183TMT5_SCHSO|nr:unnamed protein product [Schistocephalus solidus]
MCVLCGMAEWRTESQAAMAPPQCGLYGTPTPRDPSQVWWYAQGRLRSRQPPASSPASGFLDSVLTPGSGEGGGGESAVTAAQGYYHLKLIDVQVTVPAPPGVGHTVWTGNVLETITFTLLDVTVAIRRFRQSCSPGSAGVPVSALKADANDRFPSLL